MYIYIFKWEFREREKHSKLGNVRKDEKLKISIHLLESNPVNDKVCVETSGKKGLKVVESY